MMQLYQGDCLEVMKQIPDKSVDMILCDLPYGTTDCKWDIVIPFDKLWEQYNRIIKDNGAIVLCGVEPFSSHLRISNEKMYRYDWYWEKDKGSNFLFGNKQPMKVIETLSVFYKKQPTYNSQKIDNPKGVSKRHLFFENSKNTQLAKTNYKNMPSKPATGKNYEPDKLLAKSHIYFAREQRNKVHPTQKPVALMEYLIKTYTNENDTVLDTCMGSGTTGVACKHLNRNFIGIELDPNYFEIAKNRIENEPTQLTLTEQKD